MDRCDHLTSAEHSASFTELISLMLRRAPRLKLLLTCRKSVGVADEAPLTIPLPELHTAEAVRLLQTMCRVPDSHATSISELCGCMPLALRLCGCALSSNRVPITPDGLIARLEGETRRLRELRALAGTISYGLPMSSRRPPTSPLRPLHDLTPPSDLRGRASQRRRATCRSRPA